ncbi:MAG TPA: hypothetical protein VGN17_03155 [Bryobacteraceae bacterium]|jgi:hypothetical protein
MELDAIPQPELDQIERVGSADVVVGIFDLERLEPNATAIAMTREGLAGFSQPLRAMVVSTNGAHGHAFSPLESAGDEKLSVFSCALPPPGPAETQQQTISNAYRNVFAVGERLKVRACSVLVSPAQMATREWIHRLVQPVLDLGFDLVAPCYTRHTMEGLLNRSILSPLHRALYGEQLENPMGPDFGLSGKLLQHVLRQESARRRGAAQFPPLLASIAALGGLQICESHLGVRAQRPTDWENLSSLLADILGAAFLEMEERAAYWQRVRGSKSLPRFGSRGVPPPDAGTVDLHSLVESFHLGTQNLQDIWGLILPPTTLLELRRAARLSEDQFRLPDQLWARIVYDFALGHRLRTISRDHLLRSITPLYLGWIASYALEMKGAGPSEVDARIERLSKAYEENKPYLVSRWRWPDRFNP